MTRVSGGLKLSEQMLGELRDTQSRMQQSMSKPEANIADSPGKQNSFMSHLMEGVKEVNEMQVNADTMATELANGKSQNIHETMLAATKAELGFNFMVQIRNRAIEAYQEIMRMQV